MSPYYPGDNEGVAWPIYECEGCGGWYYQMPVSCCVIHPPGTCCYYGEHPARKPEAQA